MELGVGIFLLHHLLLASASNFLVYISLFLICPDNGVGSWHSYVLLLSSVAHLTFYFNQEHITLQPL